MPLLLSPAKFTLCPAEKKNSKQSTLRNKKMPVLLKNRNPHTQHLSSTSERRMKATAPYSITEKSMLSQSKMSSPSLILSLLSKECEE